MADNGEEVDVRGAARVAVLEPGALGKAPEQDELQEAVALCAGIAGRMDALRQLLEDDVRTGRAQPAGQGEGGRGRSSRADVSLIWQVAESIRAEREIKGEGGRSGTHSPDLDIGLTPEFIRSRRRSGG